MSPLSDTNPEKRKRERVDSRVLGGERHRVATLAAETVRRQVVGGPVVVGGSVGGGSVTAGVVVDVVVVVVVVVVVTGGTARMALRT